VVKGWSPATSLIVWVDTLWKLLGTSAVLVDPGQDYVLARYRRRGAEEQIIIARSAIARLEEWLPAGELEILEEKPGSGLLGTAYVHPLATGVVAGAELPAPAGTVLPSAEVGDSGTGIVTLAPRHGAADAAAARALHINGWNALGHDFRMTRERGNKYAGLPIDVAEPFIQRDLTDAGLMFAEISVRRGVPYCAFCGTALVWAPGRAWCLDLSRLPEGALEDFARLLPGEPAPTSTELVPWPASLAGPSTEPADPVLGECDRCARLTPGAAPGRCACGGTLTPVRRRILPITAEAFRTWAAASRGDAVHLFVPDRRRTPIVLENLVAREAARLRFGDVGLARLPMFPATDPATLERMLGSVDALRAALVWACDPRHSPSALVGRWTQEERRLRKFWELARRVVDEMVLGGFAYTSEPIAGRATELSDEDRAFLARFERMRIEVRAAYDERDLGAAQDRLLRFMEEDLRNGYIPLIQPRLDRDAMPATRATAFRLLSQIIVQWAELYAPIAPFTMEEAVRAFRIDQASLFERGFTPISEGLLDPDREGEFDEWVGFAAALGAARRQVGLPATAVLPKVVLIVPDDAAAGQLLRSRPILARLGRVREIEIDAPNQPWSGRRVDCRPVSSEIQRAYGSQAGRIVRILEHMPARKVLEGVQAGTLTLTIEGGSVAIVPSMVQFAESLPECVVPVPWRGTEILVVDPRGSAEAAIPALTLDGFRLVRHVKHRLRRAPSGLKVERIVVAAGGDLGAELAHHGPSIAAHLGVPHWEVVADTHELVETERSTGRTRRGEPWSVWVPGLRTPHRRVKQKPFRSRTPRVRPPSLPEDGGVDMFDEDHVARSTGVEALVDGLAAELGRPIVGPAKAYEAWDAGLHSVADVAAAPFDRLSPLPGFGPVLAAEIVRHFGGTVPPRPVRRRRPRAVVPPVAAPAAPTTLAAVPRAETPAETVPPGPAAPEPVPTPSIPIPLEAPPPGPLPVEVAAPSREEVAVRPTPVPPQVTAQTVVPGAAPPAVVPIPPPPAAPPAPAVPMTPPRLEYLLRGVPREVSPPVPQPVRPPPVYEPVQAPPPAYEPVRTPPQAHEPVRAPPLPTPPPEPALAEGIELWPGSDEQPAWKEFLDAIASGHRALCLTRLSPEIRSRAIDRPDVELVWLANTKGAAVPTIRPGSLGEIQDRVRSAILERKVEAVFVDGVEYLALIHGLEPLLHALAILDDIAQAHHARIIVPLNPGLMDETEYGRVSGLFRHRTAATGPER
jgi:hypothetical protein